MARNPYEGSKEDAREDARGEKATGLSHPRYERTPRDKREDTAGKARLKRMKSAWSSQHRKRK